MLTPASHLACQVMAPLKTSVSTVFSFYYVPPALFHHTLFSQFLQHDLPSHCLRAMLCMADSPVAANLVRNYSPHLRPEGTKEAKPTAELHRLLCAGAKEMLATYLRRWRTRRLFARGTDAKSFNVAVNAVRHKQYSVIDSSLVNIV